MLSKGKNTENIPWNFAKCFEYILPFLGSSDVEIRISAKKNVAAGEDRIRDRGAGALPQVAVDDGGDELVCHLRHDLFRRIGCKE